MIGHYVNGCGKAHLDTHRHIDVFGCEMVGTFNIKLDEAVTDAGAPAYTRDRGEGRIDRYWLLRLRHGDDERMGWLFRWEGSKQRSDVFEVLTKRALSESWKTGEITVEVIEPWDVDHIAAWEPRCIPFQTFPWSKQHKADSERVWSAIQSTGIQWAGKSVLDIGSHQGFYSANASAQGANVTAFEPSRDIRHDCRTVCHNIERQDVQVVGEDPGGTFGVILYLSVHHLPDPSYADLSRTLRSLRQRAREALYVELIMPPMFGKGLDERQVDGIVGGEVLDCYKHNVRGVRRLWRVEP